jgi:ABC-type lipoprotein release transport system permease subunit
MNTDVLYVIGLALFFMLFYRGIYFVVRFLIQLIFGGFRDNWAKRLFNNHSNVDFEKVDEQLENKETPRQDLNSWEIVASLCMFLVEDNVSETMKRAERFGDQGWDRKYNYDFFSIMAQTAKKMSNKGNKKKARELISIGHRIAEKYNKEYWIEQFKDILDRELAISSTLYWDSRRRTRL